MSKEYEIDFERILREVAENIEEGVFKDFIGYGRKDIDSDYFNKKREDEIRRKKRKEAEQALGERVKANNEEKKRRKEEEKIQRRDEKLVRDQEGAAHAEERKKEKLEKRGGKYLAKTDKLEAQQEAEDEKQKQVAQDTTQKNQTNTNLEQNKNQTSETDPGDVDDPEQLVKKYGQYYNYNIKTINAVFRDVMRYSKRWVNWYQQRGLDKFASNLEGLVNLINSVNTGVEKVYYNPKYGGDVVELGDEFEKIGNLEIPKTSSANAQQNVEQIPETPQVQGEPQQDQKLETPPPAPQTPANVQDVTNDAEMVDDRMQTNPKKIATSVRRSTAKPKSQTAQAQAPAETQAQAPVEAQTQTQTQTPVETQTQAPVETQTQAPVETQTQTPVEDEETITNSEFLNSSNLSLTKKILILDNLLNQDNAPKIGNTAAGNIIQFFVQAKPNKKNKNGLSEKLSQFLTNFDLYKYNINESTAAMAEQAIKTFGLDQDQNVLSSIGKRKSKEEVLSEALRGSLEIAKYIRRSIRKMV